jgi:hypothetical protein
MEERVGITLFRKQYTFTGIMININHGIRRYNDLTISTILYLP